MKYFYSRKGIAPIVILFIFALLGGGAYVTVKKQKEKQAKEVKVMMEVEKIKKEGLVVNLTAQNDSAQVGTATLIDQNNNKTKVVIELGSWASGASQPAHIHLGACPSPGAVKYPLNNIVNGRSETMLDVTLGELLEDLPLAVNIHKSKAEVNVYVACGDVTGDPAVLLKLKIKASVGDEAGTIRDEAKDGAAAGVSGDVKGDVKTEGVKTGVSAGASLEIKVVQPVKEFTVTASNFTYDIKNIKVKKGDKVKIVFKSAEGYHDLKIDEFNASTSQLQAGGTQTIEFTADKAGTFEYYCSVASHRAMGMKGMLTVE